MKHVRLQDIVGSAVRDPDGKVVGRIHATEARIVGNDCVILEWLIGPAALLSRLGIAGARLFGWPRTREPLRVPWDQLDLSDPDHPRLLRPADELRRGV